MMKLFVLSGPKKFAGQTRRFETSRAEIDWPIMHQDVRDFAVWKRAVRLRSFLTAIRRMMAYAGFCWT